jgi:hypothetical protein
MFLFRVPGKYFNIKCTEENLTLKMEADHLVFFQTTGGPWTEFGKLSSTVISKNGLKYLKCKL